MATPEEEKSEQQQDSSGGNCIQVGACLPLDQIKLYVVSKDGSKAEVGVREKHAVLTSKLPKALLTKLIPLHTSQHISPSLAGTFSWASASSS